MDRIHKKTSKEKDKPVRSMKFEAGTAKKLLQIRHSAALPFVAILRNKRDKCHAQKARISDEVDGIRHMIHEDRRKEVTIVISISQRMSSSVLIFTGQIGYPSPKFLKKEYKYVTQEEHRTIASCRQHTSYGSSDPSTFNPCQLDGFDP